MTETTHETPRPEFTAYGETFKIDKLPPALMLAEMAEAGVDENGGVATAGLVRVLRFMLDKTEFARFRTASFAYEATDMEDGFQKLGEAYEAAIEAASGVDPTK